MWQALAKFWTIWQQKYLVNICFAKEIVVIRPSNVERCVEILNKFNCNV